MARLTVVTLWQSRSIRAGAAACAIAVGGFVAWSATAQLSEGVVAFGKLSVENQRKTIQHLEGGIVQNILVAEGDQVTLGQPLVVLADVAVLAGRDQIAQELARASYALQRFNALLEDRQVLELESLRHLPLTTDVRREIETQQVDLFLRQQAATLADVRVQEARRLSFLGQVAAHDQAIAAYRDAIRLLDVEIKRNQLLLEQQLIRASELSVLQREQSRLLTDLSRVRSERDLAQSSADEVVEAIRQTEAQVREKHSEALLEAQAQVLANSDRLRAAQDVVDRTTIHSPHAGKVLNLRFATPGGVVRPGEDILEIVPTDATLVATVQIRPIDREAVNTGQQVDARVSSSNSWHAALRSGEVLDISADLKVSPDGTLSYYEARISLLPATEDDEFAPVPGMPVEAFVCSGRKRTFLEYLTAPLMNTLRRCVRE